MPVLPVFLGKAALAASQVLRDFDRAEFERTLLGTPVRIAFGADAALPEGRACLDLVVRLLARLYPTLSVHDTTGELPDLIADLHALARSIHPEIELPAGLEDAVTLVVGSTEVAGSGPKVYVGSHGWTASVNPVTAVPFGGTSNPFGPGAAACLGAAVVFRTVFADWLPALPPIEARTMSVLHPWRNGSVGDEADVPEVDLGETHVAGLGAVGNAALWAIARTPRLSGRLHLVDGQSVELSNLQRYVLTIHDDGQNMTPKAALAARALAGNGVEAVPHPCHWDRYLEDRRDWFIDRVAVCVDTGRDRIAVQASLPRVALNGFTGRRDLGVSRHTDFLTRPCLCCLYFPQKEGRPLSQRIADDLLLPHREPDIRNLLQQRIPVGRPFLAEVAVALGVDPGRLVEYEGRQIGEFHALLTCGGEGMRLGAAPPTHAVDAPLAFQSALAGLLLAAEVVADVAGVRDANAPTQSRSDILARPGWFESDLDDPITKGNGGRCLCEDDDFRLRYEIKYSATRMR